MSVHPPTLGLVLAGGLSRRLGGGDKALVEIGGKPILLRAAERLAPQCEALVLNANGDPARFAGYQLPIVSDALDGFLGPLAGILAGLEWAAINKPDLQWVATLPADGPFPPRDFVTRLHAERMAKDAEIACAASGGRTHPVSALWPLSIAPLLRRALIEDGERKVAHFMTRYRVAVVAWPTEPLDPFFNVNAPEDVAEAQRLASAFPDA